MPRIFMDLVDKSAFYIHLFSHNFLLCLGTAAVQFPMESYLSYLKCKYICYLRGGFTEN